MAADTLSLRERIAQVIRDNRDAGSLTDAILPVVEQAIREERDRAWKEVEDYWKPYFAALNRLREAPAPPEPKG